MSDRKRDLQWSPMYRNFVPWSRTAKEKWILIIEVFPRKLKAQGQDYVENIQRTFPDRHDLLFRNGDAGDTLQGYQDQDHRQQPASSSRRSTENVRSAPNEVGAKPLEARPSRSAESTKTAQRVPAQAPSGSQRSHTNASTKRATEPQSQKPVEIPRRPSERQAQVDEKKGSHEPPKPSNVAKEKTKDEPRLERVEENSKLVGEGAKQTEGKPKPAVQPRPSTRVDAQKPPVTQRKFFVANRGSLSPSFDSEITLTNGDNNLLNRLPKEPLPAPAAPANTLPQRRATTQATALTSAQDTATPARRATTPRTAPPRRDNDSRDQRSRPADPPQPAQSTNANAKSFPVIDLRPLTPRPPRGTDPTRVVGTLKPVAPRERHVSQPTPVAPSASSSTKANSTKANGSAKTPGPEVGQRAPTEHSRGRSTSRHTHSPSQQDTTNHSDEERGRSITPKPAERRKSPVLHNPPPSDTVPARPALRPPAKPATGFWHLLKNDTKRQNSNPERQLRIVSPPPKSPPHSPAYSSDTYQTVSDTEQSPRTRTKSKSTRPKGKATASETREYPMYNTYYGGPQDSEEDFEPFVPPGPGESRQAPRASTPAMFAEPEEDPTPYDPGVILTCFHANRQSASDELPIMDYDTSWAVPSIPPNVDLLHDTLLGITPYQLSSDVALRLVPTSPPPVQWNQQRNMPHMAGIPYQPPVGPTPYFWYGRWWP
ncbi:hypothetical protein PLICRDRAFT_174881 [Plicaturopsis crispa FD-325 SS-3]|nr:hypothetical protein PLICRDRAFT_174881 [Plicaturopsis crispa FD-325 SS-3]